MFGTSGARRLVSGVSGHGNGIGDTGVWNGKQVCGNVIGL